MNSAGVKAHKYQVSFFVDKVRIAIKNSCKISVVWKLNKCETKPVDMNTTAGIASINQGLVRGTKIMFNATTNKYEDKIGHLRVRMANDEKSRMAGQIELNLAKYLNSGTTEKTELLPLDKCPDKNATLSFKIKFEKLGEYSSEQLSAINEEDSDEEDTISTTTSTKSTISQQSQPEPPKQTTSHTTNFRTRGIPEASTTAKSTLQTGGHKPQKATGNDALAEIEKRMGKIGLTPSATGSNDSPKTTTGKTTTGKTTTGGAGGAYAKMFENNRPARPVKNTTSTLQKEDHKTTTGASSGRSYLDKAKVDSPSKSKPYGTTATTSNISGSPGHTAGIKKNYSGFDPNPSSSTTKFESSNRTLVVAEVDSAKEKEFEKLTTELTESKIEMSKLQKLVDQLQAENDDLKKDTVSYSSKTEEVIEMRNRLNDKNDEILKLHDETDELRVEKERLNQTIYKLKRENNNLSKGVAKELENQKAMNSNMESRVAEIEQDRDNLRHEYDKLQAQYSHLENDFKRLKKENSTNSEYIDKLKTQKNQVESSSAAVDLEIQKYKEKVHYFENEVDQLREQVKNLQAEKNNVQKNCNDKIRVFEVRIKELASENQKMEDRFQENMESYHEYKQRVENQIAELKIRVKDAELKKEDALNEQTRLSIELQNLRIDHDSKLSELNYYKSKGGEDDLDQVKEVFENELNSLKKRLQQKELDLKKQEQEADDALAEKDATIQEFEEHCEQLKKSREKLIEDLKRKEHEIEMREISLRQEVENRLKDVNNQTNFMAQNVDLREKKIQELTEQNRLYSQQIASMQEEKENLEKQVEAVNPKQEEELDELKMKMRKSEMNFKNEYDAVIEEKETLQSEINVLKRNLENAEGIEEQVAKMSIDNENLRKKVRELSSRASNAKAVQQNHLSKENEDLKVVLKDVQKKLEKSENEVNELKTNLNQIKTGNAESEDTVRNQNDKLSELKETLNIMENEIVRSKQKIGEIVNVVGESGNDKLIESVYSLLR